MAKKFSLSVTLQAIDRLTAPIKKMGSQIAKLKAPLTRIKTAAGNVATKFKSAFSKMGLSVTALWGTLSGFMLKFTGMGDRLAKTADKLGLSVEQLQKFRFAAERSGVEVRQFDVGFQRFTRRMSDARKGMGEGIKGLQALGIHLFKVNGIAKTSVELFGEVADEMRKDKYEADRVAIAFKFFDSEGVGLVNMLKDGQAGLDAYGKELEGLGGIIDDETARNSEAFQDMITNIKVMFTGLLGTVAKGVLPTMIGKLKELIGWVKKNRDEIANWVTSSISNLNNMAKGFIVGIGSVVSVIKGLLGPLGEVAEGTETAEQKAARFEKIGKLIAKVLTVIVAIKLVSFIVSLIVPVVMLAKAFGLLNIALWANPITWMVIAIAAGVAAIIYLIYSLIKHWDMIWPAVKRGLAWIWNGIKSIIGFFVGLRAKMIEIGIGVVTWIWDGIKMRWSEMTAWISGAWDDIIGFLGFGADSAGGGGGKIGGLAAAGAGGGSEFTGSLRVEFENAPAGTRIAAQESSGNADMDVTTGLQIAEQ